MHRRGDRTSFSIIARILLLIPLIINTIDDGELELEFESVSRTSVCVLEFVSSGNSLYPLIRQQLYFSLSCSQLLYVVEHFIRLSEQIWPKQQR
jgi:hypothetical protein